MSNRFLRDIAKSLNRNVVVRAVKNLRNDAMDVAFRATGHAERDRFLASFSSDKEVVTFAIAWNATWAIDLLTASWSRYVADSTLVVVDNSSKPEARQAHAEICRARGFSYMELPWNWEWHPNRSHAAAMNWVYYNLVRKLQPPIFGYIDHDCFPIKPVSFVERLDGLDAYGAVWESDKYANIWFLWAGFCFFRREFVAGKRIDFKHRHELGTDTGGSNWYSLYSKMNLSRLRDAAAEAVFPGEQSPVDEMEILDGSFNHIGAASYRPELSTADDRRAFADYLWATYLPGEKRLVTL